MKVEQLRNSSQKTSVIVHIDELLDAPHRENIQNIVEQVEGVSQAQFNETRHHLMIVDYDPRQTSSGRILGRVQRQHLHAQLV